MKSSFAFFKRGFFLLALLNIALIILFLLPGKEHRRPGPPHFDRIMEDLHQSLDLSDKQFADLEELFKLHRKEIDSMRRSLETRHNKMADYLAQDLPDAAADSLFAKQPGFDHLLFIHHKRIMKLLNKHQKALYLEKLKTDRPPGPPPF